MDRNDIDMPRLSVVGKNVQVLDLAIAKGMRRS